MLLTQQLQIRVPYSYLYLQTYSNFNLPMYSTHAFTLGVIKVVHRGTCVLCSIVLLLWVFFFLIIYTYSDIQMSAMVIR